MFLEVPLPEIDMEPSGSMSGRLHVTVRFCSGLLAAITAENGRPATLFNSSSTINESIGVGFVLTVTVTPLDAVFQVPLTFASNV